MIMSEAVKEASSEVAEFDGIHLGDFLQANEAQIRGVVETLLVQHLTRAIGREDLGKVNLIFEGSFLGDLTVYIKAHQSSKPR